MSSDRREHSYGDLRQAVIDVMLEAGDQGVDDFDRLLEKTALGLDERGVLTKERRRVSGRPASQLHPNDVKLVLEIVWDLVRQGILNFGLSAPKSGWPAFRLSRFGAHALRHGPHQFHDNTGFMKTLRYEARDISPEAVVYLREAVTAFYTDCLLSTCAMLSIAAEGEFLRLFNVAKNSKAYGKYFSRIGEGLNTTTKISQFKEAIRPILTLLPRSATEELDHNLNMIQSVIRTVRNESEQPAGALPPSRDQVYLYLQDFIPFAEQAMRLRQKFNEPEYPRLVRAH